MRVYLNIFNKFYDSLICLLCLPKITFHPLISHDRIKMYHNTPVQNYVSFAFDFPLPKVDFNPRTLQTGSGFCIWSRIICLINRSVLWGFCYNKQIFLNGNCIKLHTNLFKNYSFFNFQPSVIHSAVLSSPSQNVIWTVKPWTRFTMTPIPVTPWTRDTVSSIDRDAVAPWIRDPVTP